MLPGVKARLLLVILAVLVSISTGCNGCKGKTSDRTKVAVSIFPLYDIVRRIAGPDADVSLVLPPGHSEHTFDPTPKEVDAAFKALARQKHPDVGGTELEMAHLNRARDYALLELQP